MEKSSYPCHAADKSFMEEVLPRSFVTDHNVANPSQMHSELSHQIPCTGGMCLPNSSAYQRFFGQGVIDMSDPEHTQQPYQQSTSNLSLVPSSTQDAVNMIFALLNSGMDKGICGISSQARNFEDHYQLCQQNKQQTADALRQGELLRSKHEKMKQGQMRVFGDIFEGENAVDD